VLLAVVTVLAVALMLVVVVVVLLVLVVWQDFTRARQQGKGQQRVLRGGQ
jgi:uncharacterized membrane protein YidH (DUF202 family)